MLSTIEALSGPRIERVRITPLIPSTLPGRERERFIDASFRILSGYPVRRFREYAGEDDRFTKEGKRIVTLPFDHRSAASIPTTEGPVFPTFQFEEDGSLHWLVNISSRFIKEGWRRADWWTAPNEGLGGVRPVSLLNTDRQNDELKDAVSALYVPRPKVVYESL
ncbi:MAG: hypothetical protein KBD51_02285 [Candidatus Levybacteria bacterium]|nr:hypothetical protein [Candidatus Levybacteria bacterium]